MISFGRIERTIRFNGGDDGGVERVRRVKLDNIGLGDVRLLRTGREDR